MRPVAGGWGSQSMNWEDPKWREGSGGEDEGKLSLAVRPASGLPFLVLYRDDTLTKASGNTHSTVVIICPRQHISE